MTLRPYIFGQLILLLTIATAWGQDITFVADCNASDVVVGNAFKVSFRLENAEIRNVYFPDFEKDGFQVLQGPVSESSYRYVNGLSSSSEAYTFILAASKVGKLRLSPARITTTKGKQMQTKELVINSVAANTASGAGGSIGNNNLPPSVADKVLYRLEPSTQKAIVGEQVILHFKIYTQVDLSSIEISKEPSFQNVYMQPLRYYDPEARIEVVNGKQYVSKILYSVALFPSKEGSIEIEPSTLRIALGRLSSSNPFAKPQSFSLNSNPIKIEVTKLDKVPKSFTGAVGEFTMQAHVENNNINTDEAIKLTLRIVGQGDIKQIQAPPLLFRPEGEESPFDIYPPTNKEEIREGKGILGGIKEFYYTLEPNALGDFQLLPTFSYYDTRQKKMRTLDTLISLRVVQGQKQLAKKSTDSDASAEEGLSKLDPLPLQTNAKWQSPAVPLLGSVLFWSISLLPILLFGATWLGRKAWQARLLTLAAQRQQSQAERDARQALRSAKEHLKNTDSKAFFETISALFKNYLSQKLQVPLAELDKEKIDAGLGQAGIDAEYIRQLARLLQVCEMTVFAGQNNATLMQRSYESSAELLEKFTAKFK